MKRNAVYGFLGFAIPTAAIVVAYPVLVNHLGGAAFGVFILATSLSGAMAFVDLGCSAATLKFVAEDVARGDRPAAAAIIVTSLAFYAVAGAAVTALIWLLAPRMVAWFSVPPELHGTGVWVFRLAALQFEAFFITTVFVSLFKGLHRFDQATLVLSALAFLTYGGAAAGALFAHAGLLAVTAISLAANLVTLLLAAALAASLCRAHGLPVFRARPSLATLRRMFGFGVFMSINNISGILVTQVQRMVISALFGPAAVTVFASATMLVSKVSAAIGATFEFVMPLTAGISADLAGHDVGRFRRLYLNAVGTSALLSLAGMTALFVAAPVLVPLWLHSAIDAQVVGLIRIFCVGFAINGVTPAIYHLINGFGRPAANTVFFLLSPLVLYALVGVMALTGLSVEVFALCFSVSLAVNGLGYLLFAELVFWRRWVPAAVRAAT